MRHHKLAICGLLVLGVSLLAYNTTWAQIGGKSSFGFLNTPQSALVTALGGQTVSNLTDDPTLQLSNPALLSEKMNNRASFTYSPWFNYANMGSSYVHHLPGDEGGTTLGGTILYNNYGTFKGADAAGNPTGDFTASDVALVVGAAQQRGNFRLGANLKLAQSSIGGYNATAIAVDMGAVFVNPKNDFRAGVVIKNLGFGLDNYSSSASPIRTPLDIQAGITYKLQHMPLRFSVTTHSLNTWDITYQNPNAFGSNNPADRQGDNSKQLFDQLARRVILGGEFLLGKGFNVRVGYNHLINRELRQELAGGLSGFSLGAMIKVKAVELSYTQAFYHVQGSTGMFTLIVDMKRAFGKKTVNNAPAPGLETPAPASTN